MRPYLQLVIKGDRETAERVAARHGIPFKYSRTLRNRRGWETTIGRTNIEQERSVIEWYGEETVPHVGAPFPLGTLLLFNVKEQCL